jgi:hypothetical protein
MIERWRSQRHFRRVSPIRWRYGFQESRPDLADDEERRRRRWTLPRSALLWTVFFVLGILFWLSSVGVCNHPAYQLILMFSMFAFCGWVVQVPEVKS